MMSDPFAKAVIPGQSPDSPATGLGPGIGGLLKAEPEDFVVEEIASYAPCGQGEHLFLWIQKRDVSAETLVETIARTLAIPRDAVGIAGLKDRRAVTRQWVSVPASTAERVPLLNDDAIQVLKSALHLNKLKTGHLLGNRFQILIREPIPDAAARAAEICRRIDAEGIPNVFGDQRFGAEGETLELGIALLKGTRHARSIPYRRRKFLVRLALSAVQSALFNEVVHVRRCAGTLNLVQAGDVMQVRASGGLFVAEDVDVEQQRHDRRETVVTGPLFGPKMKSPLETAFALEQAVLRGAGLDREMFRAHRKLTPGGRRALLMFPTDLTCQPDPQGLRVAFTLPSGSYATVVLQALMQGEDDGSRFRILKPLADEPKSCIHPEK